MTDKPMKRSKRKQREHYIKHRTHSVVDTFATADGGTSHVNPHQSIYFKDLKDVWVEGMVV